MSYILYSHFCSILDCLNTELLKFLKVILHCFELVGRMPLPIRHLTADPKWIPRTVRLCWITRELLVRQIGVIFDRASRFYNINSTGSVAHGKFGSPNSSIQGGG